MNFRKVGLDIYQIDPNLKPRYIDGSVKFSLKSKTYSDTMMDILPKIKIESEE